MKKIYLFVLSLFMLPSIVKADGGMMGWGHMMYPGSENFFWGAGIFGMLLMIAFWGFVIWLVYILIKKYAVDQTKNDKTPLQILKERYAKGEITKKQFEEMKNGVK